MSGCWYMVFVYSITTRAAVISYGIKLTTGQCSRVVLPKGFTNIHRGMGAQNQCMACGSCSVTYSGCIYRLVGCIQYFGHQCYTTVYRCLQP